MPNRIQHEIGFSIDEEKVGAVDQIKWVKRIRSGYWLTLTTVNCEAFQDIWSYEKLSLEEGVARPGFTVSARYSHEGELKSVNIYRSVATNVSRMTHESCTRAAAEDTDPMHQQILLCVELAGKFRKQHGIRRKATPSTVLHDLISEAMRAATLFCDERGIVITRNPHGLVQITAPIYRLADRKNQLEILAWLDNRLPPRGYGTTDTVAFEHRITAEERDALLTACTSNRFDSSLISLGKSANISNSLCATVLFQGKGICSRQPVRRRLQRDILQRISQKKLLCRSVLSSALSSALVERLSYDYSHHNGMHQVCCKVEIRSKLFQAEASGEGITSAELAAARGVFKKLFPSLWPPDP